MPPPRGPSPSPTTLVIEVLDVRNPTAQGRLYAVLEVGDRKLRANVVTSSSSPSRQPEAVIFSDRRLEDLYRETLKVTVVTKEGDNALGGFSIPINRIMLGRRIDRYFDTVPSSPERETQSKSKPLQIRLAIELTGPLRPEFQFLHSLITKYTNSVDAGLDMAYDASSTVQPYIWSKYHIIPYTILFIIAIPILAFTVTVGLPIFFPLMILGLVAGVTFALTAGVVVVSSRRGRAALNKAVDPVLTKLTHTSVGQQLLYQTGPRPSINRIAKTFAPTGVWEKLILSIVIDAIGSSSYALPGLGELTDIGWAPISALAIGAMYCESSPYMQYVGLVEELLPFTDIIPTATLAWLRENGASAFKDLHVQIQEKNTAKVK